MNELMTADDMMKSLANADDNIQHERSNTDNIPFLKLDKDHGEWTYGREADPVEDDDRWAVDPRSMRYTEVCVPVGGFRSVAEVSRGLFEPYRAFTYPEVPAGHEWKSGRGMHLLCIAGPNKGQAVQYNAANKGIRDLCDDFFPEVVAEFKKAGKPLIPIVRLDVDSYDHKEWGKTYTPEFETMEWRSFDELAALLESATEEPEEEVPAPPAKEEEPSPRQRRKRRVRS